MPDPVPSEAAGERWTIYLCHACGWRAASETSDLTCENCGEPRSMVEEVEVVPAYLASIDALHEAQMEAEHHREQERFWKGRCEELEAELEAAHYEMNICGHHTQRSLSGPVTDRLRARAGERET